MSHVTGWLLLSVWLLAVVTHALPIERLELKRFIHQNQFETQRFKRSIPEGYQYKKPYKDIVNQFEAPRFERSIPEIPFEAQEFKRSIPESAFEEQEFKRSIPEFYRPEQGRFALVAYPPEQSIVNGADAVFVGMQKRLTEIKRDRRAAPKGYYHDGIVSSFEGQRLKRSIHESPFEGQRLRHSMLDKGVYINPKHSELGIVNQFETQRFKRSIPEGYQYKKPYKDIVNQFEAPMFKRSIPEMPFEAQEFKRSIPEFYRPEQGRFALVAYPPEQSIVIGADAVFAGMQKRLTDIKLERRAAPKSSFEAQRLKRSIPQSPFEGQRLSHSMLDNIISAAIVRELLKGVYINPKHSELGIVLTGLTREKRAASEAEGQYDDDGIVSWFKGKKSKRSIPKAKPEDMRASIVNVGHAMLAGIKKPGYLWTDMHRRRRATGSEIGDAVFAEMEKRGSPWTDITRKRRAAYKYKGIVSSISKRQVQPVFKEKD